MPNLFMLFEPIELSTARPRIVSGPSSLSCPMKRGNLLNNEDRSQLPSVVEDQWDEAELESHGRGVKIQVEETCRTGGR